MFRLSGMTRLIVNTAGKFACLARAKGDAAGMNKATIEYLYQEGLTHTIYGSSVDAASRHSISMPFLHLFMGLLLLGSSFLVPGGLGVAFGGVGGPEDASIETSGLTREAVLRRLALNLVEPTLPSRDSSSGRECDIHEFDSDCDIDHLLRQVAELPVRTPTDAEVRAASLVASPLGRQDVHRYVTIEADMAFITDIVQTPNIYAAAVSTVPVDALSSDDVDRAWETVASWRADMSPLNQEDDGSGQFDIPLEVTVQGFATEELNFEFQTSTNSGPCDAYCELSGAATRIGMSFICNAAVVVCNQLGGWAGVDEAAEANCRGLTISCGTPLGEPPAPYAVHVALEPLECGILWCRAYGAASFTHSGDIDLINDPPSSWDPSVVRWESTWTGAIHYPATSNSGIYIFHAVQVPSAGVTQHKTWETGVNQVGLAVINLFDVVFSLGSQACGISGEVMVYATNTNLVATNHAASHGSHYNPGCV